MNVRTTKDSFQFRGLTEIFRLVEATGAPPVVNSCFKLLRKGARIVMIGLPKATVQIEDPLPNLIFKSVTLTTVHGRRIFHTWEQCEQLIQEGKVRDMACTESSRLTPSWQIDPTVIVSHQFSLDSWQEAHDVLLSGKACKILVKMSA